MAVKRLIDVTLQDHTDVSTDTQKHVLNNLCKMSNA